MTPARFLIILAVVVLVLFGVSVAVRNKTDNPSANKPTDSWAIRFNKHLEDRQKVDPEKDFSSTCRNGRQLVIPKMLAQCTVTVLATNRSVRKVELSLSGADKFKLEYKPSPADPGAVPLKIDEFKPGKSVKLVFQKNGGQLILTRRGGLADAIVTIQ